MSTPATQRQAPPTGHYAIDPAGSSVTFVTRHMFGLSRVRGTCAVTRGELTVAEPAEQSSVTAEVSSASFSTRNFLRDPQVRSRLFLDAWPPPGHRVPLHQRPAQRQCLDGERRAHREGTAGAP